MNLDHFRATVAKLPEGIEDTMTFVGVGDHGGGPTEEQIAWCRENAHAIEGWEMVFSSPSRYFDAIAAQVKDLPVVTGELQQHAIGCYSVYRPIKTQLRSMEHRMAQAEVAAADPASIVNPEKMQEAWEDVCFHQFHDTLGGTCLPSAYGPVAEQLGSVGCTADRALAYTLRRKITQLPEDPLQRIVLWNASPSAFTGYVEFEPWLEGRPLDPDAWLMDELGNAVPHQIVQQEAACGGISRLLFSAWLEPGQLRTLRFVQAGAKDIIAGAASINFDFASA